MEGNRHNMGVKICRHNAYKLITHFNVESINIIQLFPLHHKKGLIASVVPKPTQLQSELLPHPSFSDGMQEEG